MRVFPVGVNTPSDHPWREVPLALASWLLENTTWGEYLMRRVFLAIAVGLALSACAGRDPQPIATVQVQDAYADCTMIRAEIEGNNQKAKQLADEQGMKTAQNVAAGVVGVVIWPVWFAMDSKGAAGTEAAALQSRQQYLTTLATQRCQPGYRQPPPPGYGAPPQGSPPPPRQ
jgi:hypothetical protein